ncbi:hypothetical protein BDZ45DRAFT_806631 [Acephala macrosclerotiorum]|nr:hypothetical protein BDZ45DRAFT_806631 [Acephala macrosclerotiorum]
MALNYLHPKMLGLVVTKVSPVVKSPTELAADYVALLPVSSYEASYAGSERNIKDALSFFPLQSPTIQSEAFIPDTICFDNNIDTLYLTQEALDTWTRNLRDRRSFNYGAARVNYFPPRSPASRAFMNVRSLGIDFRWFLRVTFRYELVTRNGQLGLDSFPIATLFSSLFYRSDLEEVAFIHDKSDRYQDREKWGRPDELEEKRWHGIDEESLRFLRNDVGQNLQVVFDQVESTLQGIYLTRYSRVGKAIPVVKTMILP